MIFKILIVDDEIEMCLSLSELLKSNGFKAIYSSNPFDVQKILKNDIIDLIIMDIKMPGIDGINLMKNIKREGHSIPVIIISGYASVNNIVQAMKYGALNFYEKPVNIKSLLQEIKHLFKVKERINEDFCEYNILTQNKKMLEIKNNIKKAAPTDASVFILGESGTGKELIANAIHYSSKRKDKPFIKINCAAIPDNLLESELFGYEQGAFTDARKDREGKFELANGGTIFFDEIGDMSISTQAKLLRVIQEKEFEKLGGNKNIKLDVRIIAATNKNIEDLISINNFREDLYYRLSIINIEVPPLRERKDDVLLLIKYFIEFFNKIYSKMIESISNEVKEKFIIHNWPGNIRELKNCIERAVIFCEKKQITIEDLPEQYRKSNEKENNLFESAYNSISKQMILDALDKSNGIKNKAAKLLNIHRKTLYNKMKKLGIE